ncbi:hypothetical protein COZ14_00855 [Candidatus Dojkabacteria bacterium CG_4_10_14_3_um_filter_Dojkabacteria_WS6_41_9]|uniref:Uncharacterized protein n=1 Tax=Candidatus Dojkabacteria bacterium CG_4_10_14_0_2_um_filter_Dojkabacteria_WS6_41_15 TaxID=2014249 RepID=A0A2M7W1Y7_9BACT|nr:MAG: hypothetical protein COZ14_00855 [Candidatus Dojkabacteria bacterium CG_4_10_14_3_um_filter_Dojkabacteria_WS6_41_9]PJA13913.1 MAG: hypothetical protein COX64_02635 [Candidatus Dojkabacteria bacterium CG_4_10_14_0_2_um_filter_Dojkabacteria_WS6_41_15]
MIRIIRMKVTSVELEQAKQDISNYIKFVVDIDKEIIAIGGARHVDAEQMLLQEGSLQSSLWGGGIDLIYGSIDFDSMINIRPNDNNPSKDVLSLEVRKKTVKILAEKGIWEEKN